MATLIVTYSSAFPTPPRVATAPVAVGSMARTETITMPAAGSLAAVAGENIVELLADADCWVAIGSDPDSTIATDGTGGARKLKANLPYSFHVETGDTVAVEAA